MAENLAGDPPVLESMQGADGRVSRAWSEWFQSRVAALQADGVDAAGAPTQAEFNALVAVVNGLIDKLQAAGLMKQE